MRLTDLYENAAEVIARLGITHEQYNTAYRAVLHNPSRIAEYLDWGDELKFLAVTNDGYTIQYIADPSPRLQMTAVSQQPFAIKAIRNPTEAAQIAAVERFPTTLESCPDPTLAVVTAAVRKAGPRMLRMVKVPLTPDMIRVAIERDCGETIQMFDHLPVDLQHFAFETNPYIIHQLKKLSNFDTSLDERFSAKQQRDKKAHRADQRLPRLGDRRPIGAVNQDQLAGLRWLEQNQQTSIPVKTLKQQPWGNTPFWQQLVRQTGGRDISRSDVMNADAQPAVREIMDVVRVTSGKWERPDQRIFQDRTNHIAIYSVTGREIADSLTPTDREKMLAVKSRSVHPNAVDEPNWAAKGRGGLFGIGLSQEFPLDKRYTMGWVRYTVFGRDIWIDEVQSDLPKYLDPETNLRFKSIQDAILVDFLARMRRRGAERFFMPTIEMKRDANLYSADPPQSIYTDLPKKMRMRKQILSDIDPLVDGQTGWVLEGFDA